MAEQIEHISLAQMVGKGTLALVDVVAKAGNDIPRFDQMAEAILIAAGVPALLDVAEAAQAFAKKHTAFHPDHWIAGGAWIEGRKQYCDACDLCAAITSANPQNQDD